MIPNDFYTIIGRINDLDSNLNKAKRFISILLDVPNIASMIGCIPYGTLKSIVDSDDIDGIYSEEIVCDTSTSKIRIGIYDSSRNEVTMDISDFNLIKSALDSSESELNFDLDDFDIDTMGPESSVELILDCIAKVFDPDCECLEDLEFEEGRHRYISENAVFIPLNPDKFRSVERIKLLKEYIEKQFEGKSTLRLVYNDTISNIGIICVY